MKITFNQIKEAAAAGQNITIIVNGEHYELDNGKQQKDFDAIIIYYPDEISAEGDEPEGGIFRNITREELSKEYGIKDEHILYYIPLTVNGKTYQERKNNLEETAKEWQRSNYDFIDWSYGELATIQRFFEENARRYGLVETFRENAII